MSFPHRLSKRTLSSISIFLILGVPACATTLVTPANPQVSVPTAIISLPESTAAPLPTASATPPEQASAITRTKYHLSVFLDYQTRRLDVEQTIQYLNQTGENLTELLLVVEPHRYADVFQLDALTWGSGEYVGLYSLEDGILIIPLSEPLLPNEVIKLFITYTLHIPFQASAFGYTARQINLADWYPYLPPYLAGEGWRFNPPAIVGEHLIYDIADFEVIIRSPEPGLILAAPAPAQPMATGSFYQLEAARSFIWSASLQYQTLEMTVDDTLLTAYVFPEHLSAGESALKTMAAALPLFESLYGPYPRASLTLIEADFYDGYESDGAFFLDEVYFWDYFRSPNNYLTTLTAHETAHQWWYAQVGNDPALEPWLDEALSIYSEYLFYENIYPDQTGWWWQFRVLRMNPVGYINSNIYGFTDVDTYVNTVYLRGASFLRDLRALIGDDAFFAFLRDYLSGGYHRQMTSADFFAVLAAHTDADLSLLLTVYFAEDG